MGRRRASESSLIDWPVFYEHGRGQWGQVLSSYQLQHQRVRLGVEAAGLRGQQAGLGGIAEQMRQELVVCGHGGVDVLVPEGCRVAVHFHRAAACTKEGQRLHRVSGCSFKKKKLIFFPFSWNLCLSRASQLNSMFFPNLYLDQHSFVHIVENISGT